MRTIPSAVRLILIVILAALLLGVRPAAPAVAAPAQSPPSPTTNCNGVGYRRGFAYGYNMNRGDDISSPLLQLGFTVNYFGAEYSSLYINTNGNLSFGNSNGANTGYEMDDFEMPVIAPFLADFDTRQVGSPNLVYFDQGVIDGRPAFGVRWVQAGYFQQHIDKLNDIQVFLIDRSDRSPGDFDLEFNYGQVQWETGDVNGGTAGLGGRSAIIGFADGRPGTDDFQMPGSLVPGSFLDSNPLGPSHTALNAPNCGQWVFPVVRGLPVVGPAMFEDQHLSSGCNDPAADFTMRLVNISSPNNYYLRTLVDAALGRYMDEYIPLPAGWGSSFFVQGIYAANSGGTVTQAFPIPPGAPFMVTFQLTDGWGGPVIYQTEVVLTECEWGQITPALHDVPTGYWAGLYIYRLYIANITTGCSTHPLRFCPGGSVTRAQMAVFLERGIHGGGYTPPPSGGVTGFNDVAPGYWAADWIKQLAADGITTGCGGGNYCPEAPVTRDQMALFLLRARYGAAYTPPPSGGVTGFNDVAPGFWAADWIKQLAADGITTGCGGGNYCPGGSVTRDQMSVFLVRTFNLP